MNRLSFSDDMMRALAADPPEKSMTRRPEKRCAMPTTTPDCCYLRPDGFIGDYDVRYGVKSIPTEAHGRVIKPRFYVGSLVAATCAYADCRATDEGVAYRFDDPGAVSAWSIARIMPARLAPFVLRITEVKAERLGEITDEDAVREGMMHWARMTFSTSEFAYVPPHEIFARYWDKLYGRNAWERDRELWVWAYGLEIAERRIG